MAENKRDPHTDLPPFLTRHERFTLLRVAAVWFFFSLFELVELVAHSWTQVHVTWHSDLLQSVSCLYSVHSNSMACWHCWNNTTYLTLSSVKLSWICLTIKESKSLETLFRVFTCEIFEPCLFIVLVVGRTLVFCKVQPPLRSQFFFSGSVFRRMNLSRHTVSGTQKTGKEHLWLKLYP
jgi:hypothetical protein